MMDPVRIKAVFNAFLDALAAETGEDREGEEVAMLALAASGGYYSGCTGRSAAEFLSACPSEGWIRELRAPRTEKPS